MDMSNAFGSTKWERLTAANETLLTQGDRDFGEQRFRWAAVELPCEGGDTVTLRIGCGALMGDPWAVKSFTQAFSKPVQKWQWDLPQWDADWNLLYSKVDLLGIRSDLSLTKYADDLVKIVCGNNIETLSSKVVAHNNSLNRQLEEAGYAQNMDKQVAVLSLVGKGSVQAKRDIAAKKLHFPGVVKEWTRSLGAMVHGKNSYAVELRARLAAIRTAYFQVGSFWTEKGIPFKWKRSMFIAKVQQAALVNVEAFLPSRRDYAKLDSAVAAVGRLAMRGKASTKDENGKVTSSLGTSEVLKHWGLAPCSIEAKIRRLKWYQSMARYPKDSVQVLGALLGDLKEESNLGWQTLDAEGRVMTDVANPWALRFREDMLSLATMEEAKEFVEDIGERFALVFVAEQWAEDFLKLDFGWFRKEVLNIKVPPPGLSSTLVEKAEEQDSNFNTGQPDAGGAGFLCGYYGCPAWFPTKQSMALHLKIAHHMRSLSYVCCTTNVCPVCETTFASRLFAQRHLDRSILRGHCKPNLATSLAEAALPQTLECPLCEFEAGDFCQLCAHTRLHLPAVGIANSNGGRKCSSLQRGRDCTGAEVDGDESEKPYHGGRVGNRSQKAKGGRRGGGGNKKEQRDRHADEFGGGLDKLGPHKLGRHKGHFRHRLHYFAGARGRFYHGGHGGGWNRLQRRVQRVKRKWSKPDRAGRDGESTRVHLGPSDCSHGEAGGLSSEHQKLLERKGFEGDSRGLGRGCASVSVPQAGETGSETEQKEKHRVEGLLQGAAGHSTTNRARDSLEPSGEGHGQLFPRSRCHPQVRGSPEGCLRERSPHTVEQAEEVIRASSRVQEYLEKGTIDECLIEEASGSRPRTTKVRQHVYTNHSNPNPGSDQPDMYICKSVSPHILISRPREARGRGSRARGSGGVVRRGRGAGRGSDRVVGPGGEGGGSSSSD